MNSWQWQSDADQNRKVCLAYLARFAGAVLRKSSPLVETRNEE
jgi:hypothetical protein